MILAVAVAAALQSALQPAWTYEAASELGTESVVYVGFRSEDTVVYVTNLGMVGWLDAAKGRLIRFGRVGQQVVSGTSHGRRIWLRGPQNDLIEIDGESADIYQTHSIGRNMDLRVADGSPYILQSRFESTYRSAEAFVAGSHLDNS